MQTEASMSIIYRLDNETSQRIIYAREQGH